MQNNIRTPDVGRKKAAGKQTRVVLLAADNQEAGGIRRNVLPRAWGGPASLVSMGNGSLLARQELSLGP